MTPADAAHWRVCAFLRLDEAVRLGWRDHDALGKDPDLAPLHEDPRWADLLKRVEGAPK